MATDGTRCDIFASFFEVYVDQIRDLAKLFVDERNRQRRPSIASPREEAKKSPRSILARMGSKGLEVVEMVGGDTEIRDLSKIRIKSEGDIAAVIQSGVTPQFRSGRWT